MLAQQRVLQRGQSRLRTLATKSAPISRSRASSSPTESSTQSSHWLIATLPASRAAASRSKQTAMASSTRWPCASRSAPTSLQSAKRARILHRVSKPLGGTAPVSMAATKASNAQASACAGSCGASSSDVCSSHSRTAARQSSSKHRFSAKVPFSTPAVYLKSCRAALLRSCVMGPCTSLDAKGKVIRGGGGDGSTTAGCDGRSSSTGGGGRTTSASPPRHKLGTSLAMPATEAVGAVDAADIVERGEVACSTASTASTPDSTATASADWQAAAAAASLTAGWPSKTASPVLLGWRSSATATAAGAGRTEGRKVATASAGRTAPRLRVAARARIWSRRLLAFAAAQWCGTEGPGQLRQDIACTGCRVLLLFRAPVKADEGQSRHSPDEPT
mmetsp:Transcript_48690/g.110246  ORF Transcript_48690/g.110246 Transcript_48690/m.110246 type:complete len:390 (+) Transcript_48690:2409-3578(+)